ncbi:MAG: signal peptidase I [Patescibacteria group bacterium]
MNNFIKTYRRWSENKYFETVKVIVISLAIIIPIRTYLVEPFYVKGTSMENNFFSYDYLSINKLEYRLNQPERGDVVVAKFAVNKPYVIKRVIGLPNEKIELDGKKVYITPPNGEKTLLIENYLSEDNLKNDHLTFDLGDDQYLIMGDNRRVSYDSRQQGPISQDHIKGKLLFNIVNFAPLAEIYHKIIPYPDYTLTSNY